MNERDDTTYGFAVGDRVSIGLSMCFGKVTKVTGCDMRNHIWCARSCDNVEVELTCHDAPDFHDGLANRSPRRARWPAAALRHLD